MGIEIVEEAFALFDAKENSSIISARDNCFTRDLGFHSRVEVFDDVIGDALSVDVFEHGLGDLLRGLRVGDQLRLNATEEL